MSFGKILVPLDGTAESEAALPPAKALAVAAGAELILVRVTPTWRRDPRGIQAALAEHSLEGLVEELGNAGLRVSAAVRRGDPGLEIVEEARALKVGLITMSTHGRAGLGRAVIGSVAEHVLAHCSTPILLLRPGGHRTTHVRTLLVPVDGTPGGALAASAAAALAEACGARVVLVQVVVPTPAYMYLGEAWPGSPTGRFIDPGWDEAREAAAGAYTGRLAEYVTGRGVPAEGRVVRGGVVDSIEVTAADVGADLIVMSTHGLTGPARALLGSVADEVVRTSYRPVLLIRREEPSMQEVDSAEKPGLIADVAEQLG